MQRAHKPRLAGRSIPIGLLGHLVLSGTCGTLDRAAPLDVVLTAIGDHLRGSAETTLPSAGVPEPTQRKGRHLTIVDNVHISSGSMVSRSIMEAGQYTGFYPLAKNADWEKSAAIVRNLDTMRDKIRALEKTIKTLTNNEEK